MREALEALPCVRKAEVNFEAAQATVTVETATYKPEALLKALEKAGFKSKPAKKSADDPQAKAPAGLRMTFHVKGLMKTKSGAT